MNTMKPYYLGDYIIHREGIELIARLGPGSPPDEVVGALTMIGLGYDARMWRMSVRRAEKASEKLTAVTAKIIPQDASIFDVLMASENPEIRNLLKQVAEERREAAAIWMTTIEPVISDAKSQLPEGDVS